MPPPKKNNFFSGSGLRTRAARAFLGVGALAVLYGIAAELGRGRLPDRVWLGTHYVENVQLLPPYRSLLEETAFLLESGILLNSIAVSAGRVMLGLLLGAAFGILFGLGTGRARGLAVRGRHRLDDRRGSRDAHVRERDG